MRINVCFCHQKIKGIFKSSRGKWKNLKMKRSKGCWGVKFCSFFRIWRWWKNKLLFSKWYLNTFFISKEKSKVSLSLFYAKMPTRFKILWTKNDFLIEEIFFFPFPNISQPQFFISSLFSTTITHVKTIRMSSYSFVIINAWLAVQLSLEWKTIHLHIFFISLRWKKVFSCERKEEIYKNAKSIWFMTWFHFISLNTQQSTHIFQEKVSFFVRVGFWDVGVVFYVVKGVKNEFVLESVESSY